MSFNPKGNYAHHQFDGINLWEQPAGSGEMFNGEGKYLGKFNPVGQGRFEKAPEAVPVDLVAPIEQAEPVLIQGNANLKE